VAGEEFLRAHPFELAAPLEQPVTLKTPGVVPKYFGHHRSVGILVVDHAMLLHLGEASAEYPLAEARHLGGLTMIRPADPGDAEIARTLVQHAYGPWIPRLGRVPGPMKDDYAQRIAAAQVWVLEQEGKIVGLVVLEEQPGHLLLENVAVLPKEQGQGFGRRLIAFAEQEAARRGFPQLQLCTNERLTENIALYEHLGFTETGRICGEGFERVCLAKSAQVEV
jgi:ribosomal protein S18 acetylase RimI-like enzyme